ncbi:MAG TPA: hypothetical protein VHA75_13575 [Rugosimonospora sp.]|nr:hypothetical protein [Rugosimonospora sp.]
MRTSVALLVVGEVLALTGFALWSVPLALVLAGVQCVGLALLRQPATLTASPGPRSHRRPSPLARLRRFDWSRLVRPVRRRAVA